LESILGAIEAMGDGFYKALRLSWSSVRWGYSTLFGVIQRYLAVFGVTVGALFEL